MAQGGALRLSRRLRRRRGVVCDWRKPHLNASCLGCWHRLPLTFRTRHTTPAPSALSPFLRGNSFRLDRASPSRGCCAIALAVADSHMIVFTSNRGNRPDLILCSIYSFAHHWANVSLQYRLCEASSGWRLGGRERVARGARLPRSERASNA
jgi:hypothetical protein